MRESKGEEKKKCVSKETSSVVAHEAALNKDLVVCDCSGMRCSSVSTHSRAPIGTPRNEESALPLFSLASGVKKKVFHFLSTTSTRV